MLPARGQAENLVAMKDMTGAPLATPRARRGRNSFASGISAEEAACAALRADGWTILGQRRRTAAGEIDIVADRDGLLAIIEVKHRPTLAGAVAALSLRQRGRLMSAAEILLGENPGWGREGVRFDVMLVDAAGTVRRVIDAFRQVSCP
jgi:putative endonuclease